MSYSPVNKNIHKICIVKPSAFGDIVHTLPFLNTISKRFSDAEIHWVVANGIHTFLEGHSLITKLWLINKDKWKRLTNLPNTIREIIVLRSGLRREGFDLTIDLSGILRSGLITAATAAKYRFGFAEAREGSTVFYNHKIVGGKNIHAIERYLKIAKALGCDTSEIHYPMPPFDPKPPICQQLPTKYIVISPSAGKEANRWPPERFGQLAARFELPSVIVASAADRDRLNGLQDHSGGKTVDLIGKTSLKELTAVISGAEFLISNDTGPMHIAAALNIPVFALFGPANPFRTGPYGDIHTIIRKEVDCAPCYAWKPCTKYSWKCMNELTVDKVFEVIEKKTK